MIPRQQLLDPALFMAVDDGRERGGQVALRIDGIEFAGLNERGDGRPVLGSNVVPGEECILPIDRYRPDGSPSSRFQPRLPASTA